MLFKLRSRIQWTKSAFFVFKKRRFFISEKTTKKRRSAGSAGGKPSLPLLTHVFRKYAVCVAMPSVR